MTVAMRLHNALMQRVQQQQAGHVIEQEGDSWTVAFEEPQDAVAFCLQVSSEGSCIICLNLHSLHPDYLGGTSWK